MFKLQLQLPTVAPQVESNDEGQTTKITTPVLLVIEGDFSQNIDNWDKGPITLDMLNALQQASQAYKARGRRVKLFQDHFYSQNSTIGLITGDYFLARVTEDNLPNPAMGEFVGRMALFNTAVEITNPEAIRAYEAGELKEVSVGFDTEDWTEFPWAIQEVSAVGFPAITPAALFSKTSAVVKKFLTECALTIPNQIVEDARREDAFDEMAEKLWDAMALLERVFTNISVASDEELNGRDRDQLRRQALEAFSTIVAVNYGLEQRANTSTAIFSGNTLGTNNMHTAQTLNALLESACKDKKLDRGLALAQVASAAGFGVSALESYLSGKVQLESKQIEAVATAIGKLSEDNTTQAAASAVTVAGDGSGQVAFSESQVMVALQAAGISGNQAKQVVASITGGNNSPEVQALLNRTAKLEAQLAFGNTLSRLEALNREGRLPTVVLEHLVGSATLSSDERFTTFGLMTRGKSGMDLLLECFSLVSPSTMLGRVDRPDITPNHATTVTSPKETDEQNTQAAEDYNTRRRVKTSRKL